MNKIYMKHQKPTRKHQRKPKPAKEPQAPPPALEVAAPLERLQATQRTFKPKRGVLILALGHANYGNMAANLAASIRFGDKQIPIHLVWHGDALNHFTPAHFALFGSTQEIPLAYITKGDKRSYFKAKTHLYDLSPFDETLYLDADMLWHGGTKPIKQAFELLRRADFTIQNRDYVDLARTDIKPDEWLWADPNEVKRAYNITEGKLMGLHAELVYFKRNEANRLYFEKVKEIYNSPLATPTPFAGDLADEYAFAIASVLTGRYPHAAPFMLVYWYLLAYQRTSQLARVTNEWFAFSAGGINPPAKMKEMYNLLAQAYCKGLGILPWRLQPKKTYIPERKNL